MMFPKPKRVRLKGKALARLNQAIHDRDNDRCVICGAWVDPGKKFHHEPCGADKSDEEEKGATLCDRCHFRRHNGPNSTEIRELIKEYLRKHYGGKDGS